MKTEFIESHGPLVKCAQRAMEKRVVVESVFENIIPLNEKEFYKLSKTMLKVSRLKWNRL
jgi:hypothetical protein